MCQLLVENGELTHFPQAPGEPFVSCDSMASLYQLLRIQARQGDAPPFLSRLESQV